MDELNVKKLQNDILLITIITQKKLARITYLFTLCCSGIQVKLLYDRKLENLIAHDKRVVGPNSLGFILI